MKVQNEVNFPFLCVLTYLAFPSKQKMETPLFNICSIQKNKEMKLSFFWPAKLNVYINK